ncbi:hypothetical protein Lal_00047650 [Lupinus albus]|nr:hypothetical protein Lal_00047650 [Lupinus albus]
MYAELHTAILAIELVAQKGWKFLWIECDSIMVVDTFNESINPPWKLWNRWLLCKNLLSSMRFKISHIYREALLLWHVVAAISPDWLVSALALSDLESGFSISFTILLLQSVLELVLATALVTIPVLIVSLLIGSIVDFGRVVNAAVTTVCVVVPETKGSPLEVITKLLLVLSRLLLSSYAYGAFSNAIEETDGEVTIWELVVKARKKLNLRGKEL